MVPTLEDKQSKATMLYPFCKYVQHGDVTAINTALACLQVTNIGCCFTGQLLSLYTQAI